jgi:hypothetical protein
MAATEVTKAAVKNSVIRNRRSLDNDDSIHANINKKIKIFNRIKGIASRRTGMLMLVASPQGVTRTLRKMQSRTKNFI